MVVAMAVASSGGTSGAASARPHDRSDHRPEAQIRLLSAGGPHCHFTTVTVSKPRHRGRPTAPPAAEATTAADVTVEIPPVVLIHDHGSELDVFTNTGNRPRIGDEFYDVSSHPSAPADAALVNEVIERCSGVEASP
jgi:hypothetical protein